MAFGALDVALVVLLAALPLRGLSRYDRAHRLAWYAGAAVVAVSVIGRPAGDPRHSFLATAVQFCLLFFLAPVLLALGYPHRSRTSTLVALTGPALACVVTLGWFLTPWLRVSLSHDLVFQAGHLLALGLGYLFCASAVRAQGHDAGSYPLLLLVAFLELLLDAIPGIVVTVRQDLLAPGVFLAHHGHAAAHASQVHGGELLWVIAELLDIPFLAALIYQWVRADARQAAVVDARLDAHLPRSDEGGDVQRPWWETDASVFGARAREFKPEDEEAG